MNAEFKSRFVRITPAEVENWMINEKSDNFLSFDILKGSKGC